MPSLIEGYRSNRVRQTAEAYFESRLYYTITIAITLTAVGVAYAVRLQNSKIETLDKCYNETQIIPNCYDQPQCYNQTLLENCFGAAGYYGPNAHDITDMRKVFKQEWITYVTLLMILVVEVIIRFISTPSWDAIYDMIILGIDCGCTFAAIFGTDSFIYFGIAVPLRIALFVADLDVLQPVFYKLSLNVPKIIYLLLLFGSMMYFFGMITFLLFSQENNPDCEACAQYFPDLQMSLMTMFEVSTYQNWGDVMRSMSKEPKLKGVFVLLYFASFGVLMNFVLFNIFTAVVVDVVLGATEEFVPDGVSKSFINRVFLEMCVEAFEVLLNEKEQTRIRNSNATGYTKLRAIASAVKQDIVDIPFKFQRFFARFKSQEAATLVEIPPTPAQRREEEHDYLLSEAEEEQPLLHEESSTNTEILKNIKQLMIMVRSLDERMQKDINELKKIN